MWRRGARALKTIVTHSRGALQLSRSCMNLIPAASNSAVLRTLPLLSGIDNRDTDLLLLRCLSNDSSEIRASAIHNLTGSGISRSTVDVLVMRLASSSEDSLVLKEAAYALGRLKRSEAIFALVPLLKHADEPVQRASLWALRNITRQKFENDTTRWELWLEGQSKFSHSEFEALTSEFYAGPHDLRPVLLEEMENFPLLRKNVAAFALTVLRHPDFTVRSAACNLLAQAGDFEAVPSLITSLLDPKLEVSASAWRALRALTGQKLCNRFADWDAWLRNRG